MLTTNRIDVSRIKEWVRSDYFILFVIAVVYVVIISYLAISRHNMFGTNAWDLGIYSQSLYSTINHGKILYYTAELAGNPSGSLFGIHFSPFLFLLMPIYAVFQNPVTLLVLRPIAISVGLIPLYWIIKDQQFNNRGITFFIAAIYLIYPPITTPLSNFDIEVFLPALFLFALHYLRQGKLVHSYVFVVLALIVNEFVPLIVMFMAVYVFLSYQTEIVDGLFSRKLTKHAIFGILILASALFIFFLGSRVITSFNPNALNTKWEWGEFGTSPGEIVVNVITDPIKTVNVLLTDGQSKFFYIAALFGPLAFLSFLDPLTLVMTVPWFAASLLSVNPLYYAIGTQYPAFVLPFLFVAAVTGIKKLVNVSKKGIMNKIAILMCVGLIFSVFLLPTDDYFSVTQTDKTLSFALTKVPASASVSTMPEIFPHVCDRLDAFPYYQEGVEYVLFNVYSWWYDVTLPQPAHLSPKWNEVKLGDDYGLVVNANGVLLYQKGYTGELQTFEGLNRTYTCNEVEIATGTVVQDNLTVADTVTKTDVLFHNTTQSTPLLFDIPQQVLTPGEYEVAVTLKVSFTPYREVFRIEALNKPENSEIATKRVYGRFFDESDEWQVFTFNFSIDYPTYVEFTAYVTNSTDVYFQSMNILQVSGDV